MLAAVDPAAPEIRRTQLVAPPGVFLDTLAHQQIITSAGVERYYPGWQVLPHSFTDAQFAFETGRALYGPGRVFRIEDLGLAGLLWSDDRAMKVGIAQRMLPPLRVESDLLHTLKAFVQHDLAIAETARALHIHRHTLAYRLDKIVQWTGIDPRHFAGARQLAAALVLQRLHDHADMVDPLSSTPFEAVFSADASAHPTLMLDSGCAPPAR